MGFIITCYFKRNYRHAGDEVVQRRRKRIGLFYHAGDDRLLLYFPEFRRQKIALGVAYALWEGIGIVLITIFSVQLFGEPLSPMKIAGLAVLIAGIMLIKTGTTQKKEPQRVIS